MNNRSAEPRVLISILNWNGLEETKNCLESLRRSNYPSAHVLVIDNGSRNDEVSLLKKNFPEFEFLRNEQNSGFAGGHNRSISLAIERGFDFIWILNNDCTVGPEDLGKLVRLAESDPRIGLVSPVIVLPPLADGKERYQFSGAWHDWNSLVTVRPTDLQTVADMEARQPENMWLTGTALLARCSMLGEIGGLDERLFAYYEDNEISVRAARHGYLNKMAFDVKLVHHSFGNSFDRPPHYFYLCSRNEMVFWSENTPRHLKRKVRRRLICRSFCEARSLYDSGRQEQAKACVAGVRDALLGRLGRRKMEFLNAWFSGLIARNFPYRFARIFD